MWVWGANFYCVIGPLRCSARSVGGVSASNTQLSARIQARWCALIARSSLRGCGGEPDLQSKSTGQSSPARKDELLKCRPRYSQKRITPVRKRRCIKPERWVPERRGSWRYLIDPRRYRLLGSPETWGLPITVTADERDLKGYCNQIAEGGIGAVLPEEVPVGSVVSLRFALPHQSTELHVQAVVSYRLGFQHGVALTSLNESERLAIRQFCNELPPLPDKRLEDRTLG